RVSEPLAPECPSDLFDPAVRQRIGAGEGLIEAIIRRLDTFVLVPVKRDADHQCLLGNPAVEKELHGLSDAPTAAPLEGIRTQRRVKPGRLAPRTVHVVR